MSRWDDEYNLCPWNITQEAQGEAEEKIMGRFDEFIEGIRREEEMTGQSVLSSLSMGWKHRKEGEEGWVPESPESPELISSETLGLYRVSRGTSEWEQPRAFVVIAESAEDARQVYPDQDHYRGCKWRPAPVELHGVEVTGGVWIDDENFELSQAGKSWVDYRDTTNWPDPKYLEVEYLGRVLTNSFSELTENPGRPLILLISYTGS
jgi:hypothetical protein